MERAIICDKVVIKEVRRIKDAYCTYASMNVTDKIYAVCECVNPYCDDNAFELGEDFCSFKVAIVDLMKDSGNIIDREEVGRLTKKLNSILKNKIVYLSKPCEIVLRKENTFVGFTPGNYEEIYKKRVSRKMINEVRRFILGTHKVPSLSGFLGR